MYIGELLTCVRLDYLGHSYISVVIVLHSCPYRSEVFNCTARVSETAAQHMRVGGTTCETIGSESAQEAGRVGRSVTEWSVECESIPQDRRCQKTDIPDAVEGVT